MAEEVQDIAIQEGNTPQARKVPSMDEILGTKTKKVPSMEEVLGSEKKNPLSSQYASSPTQSPLASPNFSQGEKMAKVGFTIPQSEIGRAVQKDKKVEGSTAAGIYNTLVGSISSLGGGFAYMSDVLNGPIGMPLNVRVANAEADRRKVADFIQKARSSASSPEFEKQQGQFDITNGVDIQDIKGLAFQTPKTLLDMGIGALSGGGSYFAQAINDNQKELEESGNADKLSPTQKVGYLFTQGAVQAALEKVGLDQVLGHTGLTKKVGQKLAADVVDEFVQKGIKATAKDIENAVLAKATKLVSKIKNVGLNAGKSFLAEGSTEGIQQGASDAIKTITNKIAENDVFNQEDINTNFWKNIVNNAFAGGITGGIISGGIGAYNNTNKAIRSQIAAVQSPQDLANLQTQIAEQVEKGNITPQEAEAANIKAEDYAKIAAKIPTQVSTEDKYKIIGGIDQRNQLKTAMQTAMDDMSNLDESFKSQKQDEIDLLQAKLNQVNDYIDGIVGGKEFEYKEKKGEFYKVDSEGKEMPITKQDYDIAKAVQEENKRKESQQQEQQKNGTDKRQEQFDVFSQLASSNPEFKFTDSFDEFNKKIDSEGGEQYLKDLYNQSKPFVQTGDLGEVETNTEENFVNYLKPKEKVEPIKAEIQKNILDIDNKEFNSSQGHNVNFENGKLIVKNKKGEILSDKASKTAIKEYEDNFDYSIGERATNIPLEINNERDAIKYALDNTKNPLEIAEIYANEQPMPFENDAKMQAIAEYGLGRIKTSSYKNLGDPNNIEKSMYLKIFSEKEGIPIDVLAKSISDKYEGLNIEPKDIVDYIEKYSRGDKNALKLQETDIQLTAVDNFKKLTGLDLNENLANKILDKELEKENKNELKILNEDYENAKQLEDAYWAEYKKTDGFTKESPTTEINQAKKNEEQLKPKENAVQKSSTEGVLPLTPSGVGEEGGKREGMGQGVQGEGITQEGETTQPKGTTKENVVPPSPPIQEEGEKKEPLRTNEKAILKRLFESKNISEDVKNKFKDNLKYKTASKEEARNVAKEFVKEYGSEDAVTLAEAGKFDGDVNSFIFAEAIDNAARKEMEAKTEEEKIKYASEWADYAMRYDEAARKGGRFISAISDFYKKSPLGVLMVEKANRENSFKEWFKNKEKSYKEVFDELTKEPEFKDLMDEKVQSELKEERKKTRADKRQKIDDFFEKAKLKGNNLYAVPIPPQVINGALEAMKQAVLAGESVVNAVNIAVEYVSKEVKDWDKEKFRKEYEEKLSQFETSKTTKTESELTKDKQDKMLDSFRKKLKGLNEEQKADVIRRSFKKLVENGALEYDDFKKIIQDVMGNGELTQEEQDKIKELVTKINSVEDVAKSIREDDNRSEENLKKYKEAKKEAEQASTELVKMVYNKIDLTNRVLSIMQLNTLGIPSLVNNPIFNIWNQSTVRFPIGVQLSVIDQILYGGSKVSNKLFGTSILYPENNIFISQKSFFSKLLEGAKQSTEQLFTGLTNADYFQKEVRSSQIHPFTSIKELWDWKFNGKPLTKEQVADKLLQAGPGFTAEIVARLLNIGDKPQRYAAEGAQAAVFAKKLGLKGVDLKYFMEFPKEEAYRAFKKQGLSDEVAMQKAEEMLQRIIKQGEESTFQQNNLLNDAIQGAFKPFGKAGDVIKTLNMPYVKIPLNAFWSVYNLINPEVAFLQSAVYGLKAIKSKSSADIQESKKWFAHAVTGMALTAIVGALVKAKIVNSDNDDETTKKERMGEKSFEQQNSINVSKLNAYLRGENPDDVKDGLNVDLKWFGNVGNVMNVTSQKLENMTPEQKKNGMSYMEDMMERQSESAKELINNGVFANTSGLLTAATKGGQFLDALGLNLINMGANVIQPAIFAQMSRAQLPYYSQQKADSFMKELENSMLTRSGTLRTIMNKYPPSQNNIWGERMDRKDNVIMKLFGMSKTDPDNFAQPIYKDYKRTDNTKFFPPSIKPEVNNKPITNDQLNKLEVLVGQKRKMLVAPFINDGATLKGFKGVYSKLSDDDKVDALNIIYKMAYDEGEKDFVSLYPDFYASKKKTKEQKKETEKNKIFRKSLPKFLK